ncbi:hypothetical protein IFT84_10205 [Rhizobium sp. CFBP 8762]|uniref:hypothetical protein n=1 Tax=Rhizobium sp. CFBP 8762 TaxID=2775279 RepID=UPI0017836F71|nr:hypothetical protein [Rhizobium sp. CFBP 8762]MBD8554895.1 hypothetical protein [Rhizobium sp. CFBP 8762]
MTQQPTDQPLTFGYTNWRGEYGIRTAVPMRVWFGTSEWHKEPQWLLTAWDIEKNAAREFALCDMVLVKLDKVTALEERLREANERADRMAADWFQFCEDMGETPDAHEAVAYSLQARISNLEQATARDGSAVI